MLRVIILTAGVGSRISREIAGLPKSLLKVNGVPLIRRNLDLFSQLADVSCHVVIGYKNKEMEAVVLQKPGISTTLNPLFDKSNSIFSLYLAFLEMRLQQEDSLLVINGDVFFEESLATEFTRRREEVVFFADSSRKIEADYKLTWDEKNLITDFGKDIEPLHASGEYVGAAYIPHFLVPNFVASVREEIGNLNSGLWWEEALFRRLKDIPLSVVDVFPKFWAEIDYVEDFQRITDYLLGITESSR